MYSVVYSVAAVAYSVVVTYSRVLVLSHGREGQIVCLNKILIISLF